MKNIDDKDLVDVSGGGPGAGAGLPNEVDDTDDGNDLNTDGPLSADNSGTQWVEG